MSSKIATTKPFHQREGGRNTVLTAAKNNWNHRLGRFLNKGFSPRSRKLTIKIQETARAIGGGYLLLFQSLGLHRAGDKISRYVFYSEKRNSVSCRGRRFIGVIGSLKRTQGGGRPP